MLAIPYLAERSGRRKEAKSKNESEEEEGAG